MTTFSTNGSSGGFELPNTKTLVIASHPYPDQSVVNRALQQTAQAIEGVQYRNLETLYGNDITTIDVVAERKAYDDMDRVVFMFPLHRFNLTPMLKAYLNEVWLHWGHYELRGKKMLVVITTGLEARQYSHEGHIGLTINEILAPMRACANYMNMIYLEPLAFLGVTGADFYTIRSYQLQFKQRLSNKD